MSEQKTGAATSLDTITVDIHELVTLVVENGYTAAEVARLYDLEVADVICALTAHFS